MEQNVFYIGSQTSRTSLLGRPGGSRNTVTALVLSARRFNLR